MNTDAMQNDETFHRSVGKVCQDACPVSLQKLVEGNDASPTFVSNSSLIDISPHHLLEVLEQDKSSNQLVINISINLIVERSVVHINPQ